jgi:UDP-N-acetylmuramate dehydrogenase
MCEIITEIRNSKLPDVKTLGNVGSFFKNPTVSKAEFERLKQKDENIVWFEDKNGVKLSAAYLIQSCGFKGKRFGNVGMHAKQALVLVNYGQATGEEIYNFAKHVIDTVKQTFDVDLEIEAHIVGNTAN